LVKRGTGHGLRFLGIREGWKGVLERDAFALDAAAISGILHRGGTILGRSRTNPYKKEGDRQRLEDGLRGLALDALVAMGGEDTLGVAAKLSDSGFPVVGVPKTIDNDLSGTDVTF